MRSADTTSGRRRILFAACLVLVSLLVPGWAQAGSIGTSGAESTLTYQAGPGEANQVTITMTPDGSTWYVTDTGAPVVAGDGCASIDTHNASCAVPEPGPEEPRHALAIRVGDMADRVSAGAACQEEVTGVDCRTSIGGGPGPDVLIGPTEGLSFLLGGTGQDELSGSVAGDAGVSVLVGGAGGDVLSGDRVSYQGRVDPVRVTLNGEADDGRAGENDAVLAAWSLAGGSGDDTLVGDSGYNMIDGSHGNDLIRAGAGEDIVGGDGGADRIFGGAGEDLILGHSGNDALFGGAGADDVLGEDGRDVIRGGAGRDDVRGGRGSDTFYMRDDSSDGVRGGPGRDRARIDHLDLRRSIERLF